MIGGYILAEGLSNNQGDLKGLPQARLFVVDEIGNQPVLDPCVVFGRLEAPGNIVGKLNRKRVDILPTGEMRIFESVQQVLHGVEVLAPSVFDPVFGAAFKPLAPLLS